MNKILQIIILAISCFLYFIAPEEYSLGYCAAVHYLFLIDAILLYIYDLRNEKVGFNLLFSISFYFTSFVYPVFIYPVHADYSLFVYDFNDNVISKCTALAQVAYACYACGYSWKSFRIANHKKIEFGFSIPERTIKIIEIWTCLYFILFVCFGGLNYFEDRYIRGDMSRDIIVQYLLILFFPIVTLLGSMLPFTKSSSMEKSIYVILVIISLILLSTGTRTIPLFIFSSLFIIYCSKHKVSLAVIIISVVIGVLLMSYIGHIRSQGVLVSGYLSQKSDVGWLRMFSDLFINNRNLYVFYDYVQNNGYTYGLTMISDLLAPIPFAQSFFINITGIPRYMLSSSNFSTFLQFGTHSPFGLGSHIVGDVYLSFGLVGIFVLFWGLGYFVSVVRKRMWDNSYFYLVIYLVLASDAIFMCRAAFLNPFRTIIWSLLLCWIVVNKYRKREQIIIGSQIYES